MVGVSLPSLAGHQHLSRSCSSFRVSSRGSSFLSPHVLRTHSLAKQPVEPQQRKRNYVAGLDRRKEASQRLESMAKNASAAVASPPASANAINAEHLVGHMRKVFRSGLTRNLKWREQQLLNLAKGIAAKEQAIYDAVQQDLGRAPFDSFAEVFPPKMSAEEAAKNLAKWARPTKVSTNVLNLPAQSEIVPDPYGVVLIIIPWNFPFTLSLEPLVGALAAGNGVVLKPSELAPHCSAVLQSLVEEHLDSSAVKVVQGGPEVAVALLEQKWDKIFFTGGTEIGRKVAMAAARHLTPVTLELGGKNPCYLDGSVDFPTVCKRIAWGMCLNAGQVCLKPEYILVEKSTAEKLVDMLKKALVELYGEDPSQSPDIGRIVSDRHLARLSGLLADKRVQDCIVVGGQSNKETRYLGPTLLRDVPWDSQIMQEETFGPILAIQTVKGLDEAIGIINDRPKPLALYVFSQQKQVVDRIVAETSSGAVVTNDTITHITNSSLPFGGVGDSGMGSYHGRGSFECFSHLKAVMRKGTLGDVPFRYPPSTPFRSSLMRALFQLDIVSLVLILLGLKK